MLIKNAYPAVDGLLLGRKMMVLFFGSQIPTSQRRIAIPEHRDILLKSTFEVGVCGGDPKHVFKSIFFTGNYSHKSSLGMALLNYCLLLLKF